MLNQYVCRGGADGDKLSFDGCPLSRWCRMFYAKSSCVPWIYVTHVFDIGKMIKQIE